MPPQVLAVVKFGLLSPVADMVLYAHATLNKHHRRSERGGVQRRPGPHRAVGGEEEPRRRRARAPQGRQGPCGEAVCKEAIRHCEKRGSGTMECQEGLAVSATLSVLQGFPGRDLIIRAVVNHGPIEQ